MVQGWHKHGVYLIKNFADADALKTNLEIAGSSHMPDLSRRVKLVGDRLKCDVSRPFGEQCNVLGKFENASTDYFSPDAPIVEKKIQTIKAPDSSLVVLPELVGHAQALAIIDDILSFAFQNDPHAHEDILHMSLDSKDMRNLGNLSAHVDDDSMELAPHDTHLIAEKRDVKDYNASRFYIVANAGGTRFYSSDQEDAEPEIRLKPHEICLFGGDTLHSRSSKDVDKDFLSSTGRREHIRLSFRSPDVVWYADKSFYNRAAREMSVTPEAPNLPLVEL